MRQKCIKIPKQELYVKITVPALITYDNGGPIDRCAVRNIRKAIKKAVEDLPAYVDFESPDGEGAVYDDYVGPIKYKLRTPESLCRELNE